MAVIDGKYLSKEGLTHLWEKLKTIFTKQTETNVVANAGAKNLCPYNTLIATASGTVVGDQPINLPAGTYILSFKRTATSGSTAFRFLYNGASVHTFTVYNSGSASKSMEFTLSSAANQLHVYTSIANTYTEMMIRRKEVTDATYQPYAPTNSELYEGTMTKNLCASSFGSQKIYGVTFAVGADGSITANGQASQTASIPGTTFLLKAGTYIFSCASGSSRDSTYDSYVYDLDHSKTVARDNPSDSPGTTFTLTQDTNVRANLRVASGYNASDVVFRPMIRRVWDNDTTYQPYAPTDSEAIWGIGTPIPNGTDLNGYQTIGIYYRNADSNQPIPENAPENSNYFKLIVECVYAPVGRPKQTFVMLNQSGTYYTRVLTKDGWTQWQRFVSTENMLDRGKQITASESAPLDIHTVVACGRYFFFSDDTNYMTNLPFTGTGGEFVVEQVQSPNRIRQTFYPLYLTDGGRSAGEFYVSFMYNGTISSNPTWSPWYKFEGTAVT